MGTRWYLPVVCPDCGFTDEAYFAPTCNITDWRCPKCGHVVDLYNVPWHCPECGHIKPLVEMISSDQTANADEIAAICREVMK